MRVQLALVTAACAALSIGGSAHADPITYCDQRPPAFEGCLYVHVHGGTVCVTGGGEVAGRRFQLAPCPA